MNFTTKDIFLTKNNPDLKNKNLQTFAKITQAFEKITQENHYIISKIGKVCFYEEINDFNNENIMCPAKCNNRKSYIYEIYYSIDKTKRILCLKCCKCNQVFLAYQEIDE